jgi:hypothetical protein
MDNVGAWSQTNPQFNRETLQGTLEPWQIGYEHIAEFECLLDEVAREDRGPQALRGHLTSETGLVYTLLAHAARRLG